MSRRDGTGSRVSSPPAHECAAGSRQQWVMAQQHVQAVGLPQQKASSKARQHCQPCAATVPPPPLSFLGRLPQ